MRHKIFFLAAVVAGLWLLPAWFRPPARAGNPAVAPAPPASPGLAPAPAAKSMRDLDIKEITLENGLRLFVLEYPASPTFAGYYQFRVGSAMDPKGRSGIAHLLEHMMFKGTTNVGALDPEKEAPMMARIDALWSDLHRELAKKDDPFATPDEERIAALRKDIEDVSAAQKDLIVKNEFDEVMTRAGAVSENASTWNDGTNYFLQLPANRLELWFMMESDRLLNPVFREFYSERSVVQEERKMGLESNPDGQAWEALMSLMYPAHPYGTPVIGWPKDLERLILGDAMAYFKTYYSPSNCVMVLVGDVKTAEVDRLARKYFGSWKRQEIPSLQVTSELEQTGERRRVVEFDASPSLFSGYVTPPEGHKDQYSLEVLASILGGMGSSRLERSIVKDSRIAASVHAENSSGRYSGQFVITGEVAPGHTAAELEEAVGREIARVQDQGVTKEELERAKIQVEASRVRRLKSNLGLAFEIGGAVASSGSPGYIRTYEDRLNAVTADDVKAAARAYLKPSYKNVVEVRKPAGTAESKPPRPSNPASLHQRGGTVSARGQVHSKGFQAAMALMKSEPPLDIKVPEIGKEVKRVVLPCGTVVFVKEDHSAPSVEIGFTWVGGYNSAPVPELARYQLADDLLTQGGTEALDPEALEARQEDLGMSFSYGIGDTTGWGSFWSLSRNFDESFALALDMMMKPRFDAKRLDVIKGQYVDRMRRRFDYPGWAVYYVQDYLINGKHPRLGYQASKAEVEAVTPDDVRQAWLRYIGNNNLYLTVVGDFQTDAMLKLLKARLCGWRAAQNKTRDYVPREPVTRPGVFVVEKEVSAPAIRMGHQLKVDRTVPANEHAALEILDSVLGGGGFRSRLMERLRSDEGLTYGVYSNFSHEERPGVPGEFDISCQTRKATVGRAVTSALEECDRIVRDKVSAAEVEEQIDTWTNRFVFRFSNTFSSVKRLMGHEIDDRPYDRDRQVLQAIEKVTPDDVFAAAQKYLTPKDLTIAIFGSLGEDDAKAFKERFGLTVLPREDVFRGGYEEETPAQGKD